VVGRPLVVTAGVPSTGSTISRAMPLVYDDRGEKRDIGVLYVEASLDAVYSRLIERGIVIAISQGLKTFLVSLFTLYIVHRLVTRHLMDIASRMGAYQAGELGPPLALTRRVPRRTDELDRVVRAFNDLRSRLHHAYDDLRDTNEALEQDIRARKAAEAEIIRLNEGLEQRVHQRTAELELTNRELSAFTYSVSHDLRAPVRRIAGFAQMLQEGLGDKLDDKGLHYITRIRAGARDMQEMIESFLYLARAAQVEQVIEPFDLSRMATAILQDFQEREPQRKVEFTIEPGLQARGDRRLFRNALQNLFDNAWKYTRSVDVAHISLTTSEIDGRRVYCVRDNGAGFDHRDADRLFTPFKRLHRREEFEGTGIGLATVQRIIARHGGRVWAVGEVGQGAAFYFTLWDNETVT
jgi:signal transduction histidine kinase